ncbi:hypothetical protein PPROV_000314000 [Pycnococcus provasolii]|uniref:DNA damage-binding protein CMR1 n=1 Tax=Pycnococcus provasolii TaxID=41880 RepID=A0A830HAN6_9CHLO|nr:hypothetical protein PPROV_000314000 [Pycnococcus provasolii]
MPVTRKRTAIQDAQATKLPQSTQVTRKVPRRNSSASPRHHENVSDAADPATPPLLREKIHKTATTTTTTTTTSSEEHSADANPDGLAQYELERLERMRQNALKLAALNIPSTVAAMEASHAKAATPSSRGLAAKKRAQKPKEILPRRASLRQRGAPADPALAAGVDVEARGGRVTLNAPLVGYDEKSIAAAKAARDAATAEAVRLAEEREERNRVARGPIKIEARNAESTEDNQRLVKALSAKPTSNKGKTAAYKAMDASAFATMKGGAKVTLREPDVAKVTPNGTAHMAWAPPHLPGFLAAGDKSGNVAIWDVRSNLSADSSSASTATPLGDDGVLVFRPHAQYISGMSWDSSIGLVTSSYDGTARMLDVSASMWQPLVNATSEELEFSAMEYDATHTRLVWLATNEGELCAVDPRARPANDGAKSSWAVAPISVFDKKINTVSVDARAGASPHIALSSNGPVAIYDARRIADGKKEASKPLHMLMHSKSVQGAYFEPCGPTSRLLTTCYDDFIRVWDGLAGDKPSCPLRVKHNNNTGRWVMPFRASWCAAGSSFFIGSMNRQLEMYDVSPGIAAATCLFRQTSDHMTAIASRYAQHPTLACCAAATSSGRIHLFRV